ncbi:hypothetical protein C0583_06835 [Candidatus Parcubacteria bacterium]|nr:MAG: hypothetical protein C0583_06835 [Candidatus Parcubacteria bacterium]
MQKELIKAFKDGKLESEKSKPKHVETTISNVFIFETQVYKIYKDDCEFFNELFFDLSKKDNRFDFSKRDFDWNNFFTPNVYTDLFGCKLKDGEIVFVNHEIAEELVVVMNKIDTENGLAALLYNDKIDESKAGDIGSQLAIQLNRLPEVQAELSFAEAMEVRRQTTLDWISSVPEHVKGKTLSSFKKKFEELYKVYAKTIHKNQAFGPCLDIHLENLIYTDGQLLIIDSYMPKKEWVVADMNLNFYRCAIDILALSGKANYEELKRTFENISNFKLNKDNENFYLLYGGLVSIPTLFKLGEADSKKAELAKKYLKFMKDFVKKI